MTTARKARPRSVGPERIETMAQLQTYELNGERFALIDGKLVPVQSVGAKGKAASPAKAEGSTRIPAPVEGGNVAIRAAFGGPAKYGPGCATEGCGRQTAWDKRRGDWRKRCPSRMLATDPNAAAIAKRYKAETVVGEDGNAYVMLPACERSARQTAEEREAAKAELKQAQEKGRATVTDLVTAQAGTAGKATKAHFRVLATSTLGKVLDAEGIGERDMLQWVVPFASKAQADRFAASVAAFPWADYGWKVPTLTA